MEIKEIKDISGADLDEMNIMNSQGKNFKYFPKSGNIFENRNKIGKFRIFHKVYLSAFAFLVPSPLYHMPKNS